MSCYQKQFFGKALNFISLFSGIYSRLNHIDNAGLSEDLRFSRLKIE